MPRVFAWAVGLSMPVWLLIGGCGNAGFSGEIRVPLEQRHALTPTSPLSDQVRLPGDRVFNIHLKTSDRDAGPVGAASSDSDATPDGNACCTAQAANGGTSSAQFTLGDCIDNETDRRQSVAIQVECELEHEIRAPHLPAPKTLASANLTLMVLDRRKRPLVSMPVTQVTSDQAIGTVVTTQRFQLSAVFEPHQSYNIFLQGKVDSATAAGQEAAARLQVRQLKMGLTFSPAPPESAPASAPAKTKPASNPGSAGPGRATASPWRAGT